MKKERKKERKKGKIRIAEKGVVQGMRHVEIISGTSNAKDREGF